MRRRDFLALACGAWPAFASGQTAKHAPRVGLMFTGTAETTRTLGYADDFRAGLRELGLIDGENVVVEIRYGERHPERLPELAAELVALPVDIIMAGGESFNAARRATTTTPLVSAGTGNVVEDRVAQSLAHPGGNVTGVSTFRGEDIAKRLELLSHSVLSLDRVGIMALRNDSVDFGPAVANAARALKLELRMIPIEDSDDFEPAFAQAAGWAGALVLTTGGRFTVEMPNLAALAPKYRLPTASPAESTEYGIMLGYGSDLHWQYRRAASFVAKILNGAKPGDLPFERPTRFRTTVNLKTAAVLGLTIPPDVLAADEVIE